MRNLILFLIFFFFFCIVFIAALIQTPEEEVKQDPKPTKVNIKLAEEKETPKKQTEKPTIKPTTKLKVTKKPTKKPNLLNVQINILKKNFKGIAEIKYKKDLKIIEIIPKDNYFMLEVGQAMDGDLEALSIWNDLTQSIKAISAEIEDPRIAVVICNNLNKENYILMVMDGTVLYNIVEE